MKYTFLLFALLTLFGNQDVFGQCTLIKGEVVGYFTGEGLQLRKIKYVYNGGVLEAFSNKDGYFEIQLELESDSGYVWVDAGVPYGIKIYNIPRDVEQVDFGKIKLVPNYLQYTVKPGHSILEISQDAIEKDNKIRKEVLKKYRLNVNGKKLKPRFVGSKREYQKIVFDFKE